MKLLKPSLLMLALAVALPAAPSALAAPIQAPAQSERALTIEDAFAIASDHNRQLKAARQQLEGATAGLDSVLATRFPALSAGSGLGDAGPPSQLRSSLSVNYDLDTHGARASRIRIGEAQRKLASLALAGTSQEVRLQVAESYWGLVEAEQSVRISRLYVANAETSVQDAEVMVKAGEGTTFDVQRARVHLGNARQGLASAESQLVIARRQLVRLLGLPAHTQIASTGKVAAVPDWKPSLAESLAMALERRPSIQERKTQEAMARAQSQLAWSNRGLQSQVFANGGTLNQVPGMAAAAGMPTGPEMTFGARVSWLLVDWGANEQAARQADLQAEAATTQVEDAELQVRFDVEQAYAQLEAARVNIQVSTVALEVAKQGLESARLRFKGGVGTQTDVLLAQEDLVQAEGNRVRAILAFNRAVAALERVAAAKGLGAERT